MFHFLVENVSTFTCIRSVFGGLHIDRTTNGAELNGTNKVSQQWVAVGCV